MSIVKSQQAIDSTSHNRFAIFITRDNKRFAVRAVPSGYKTYMKITENGYAATTWPTSWYGTQTCKDSMISAL